MHKIILPKISKLTPKEKARDILGRKSREDAVKEITQLVYLSEDQPAFNQYWQDVLASVVNGTAKKPATSIW